MAKTRRFTGPGWSCSDAHSTLIAQRGGPATHLAPTVTSHVSRNLRVPNKQRSTHSLRKNLTSSPLTTSSAPPRARHTSRSTPQAPNIETLRTIHKLTYLAPPLLKHLTSRPPHKSTKPCTLPLKHLTLCTLHKLTYPASFPSSTFYCTSPQADIPCALPTIDVHLTNR